MLKLKIVLPVLITLVVFVFLTVPNANACSYVPQGILTSVTENKKFLLVQIHKDFDNRMISPGHREEQVKLRDKYTQPGLYMNDGSSIPVWTMEFEEDYIMKFGGRLYTSFEGYYLASVGEFKSTQPLVFYKKGQLIKSYNFDDLGVLKGGKEIYDFKIDSQQYPFRAACGYPWIKEIKFYEAKRVLKIDHLDGRTLYFDIRTGEYAAPVAEEIDLGSVLINWSVVGFVLLLIVLFYVHRRNKKRTKKIN
jgi:hypothetical protein